MPAALPALPSPALPQPPLPALPGYRLLERLGAGPSGQVYRARDEARDRDVAVKLLDPRRCTPRGLVRFAATARAAAAVEAIRACELLDVVTDPRRPYVVLELLPGESLAQLLLRTGPLPWRRARGLAHSLAVALEAAHDAGLVHGALKPGNVFLDGHRLYLADFGAHALLDPPRRDAAHAVADYLAPEQIRGEPPGPQTDLYGLGLVVYEALTGRRLFTGRPQDVLKQHLGAPPPPPSRAVAGLPPSADALLAELLHKASTRRPCNASELRGRLSGPERAPDGKIPIEEMPTIAWSRPPDQPDALPPLEETLTLPNLHEAAPLHNTTVILGDRPDPNATVYLPGGAPPFARRRVRDMFVRPWPIELTLFALNLALAAVLVLGLLAGACAP